MTGDEKERQASPTSKPCDSHSENACAQGGREPASPGGSAVTDATNSTDNREA